MKKSEIVPGTEIAFWGREYRITKEDVLLSGRNAVHGMVLGPAQRQLDLHYAESLIKRAIQVNSMYGEKAERVPVIGPKKGYPFAEPNDEVWDTLYLIPPINMVPWAEFQDNASPRIAAQKEQASLLKFNNEAREEMTILVRPSMHRMVPPPIKWEVAVSAYGTPNLVMAPIRQQGPVTMDLYNVEKFIGPKKFRRYEQLFKAIRVNIDRISSLNQVVRG